MADFWDQFPIYEHGGVTGQPTVDPSQLQPGSIPQIDYSRMDPNTAARLQSEAAGYGMGRKPGQSDEEWRSQLTGSLSQQPPGQALQPGNSAFGQAGGNGINSPTFHGQGGGTMNLASLGSSAMGGMFGIGGGHANSNAGGAMTGLQRALTRMRTPSGRILSVPMEHIQEALRRGATHA